MDFFTCGLMDYVSATSSPFLLITSKRFSARENRTVSLLSHYILSRLGNTSIALFLVWLSVTAVILAVEQAFKLAISILAA